MDAWVRVGMIGVSDWASWHGICSSRAGTSRVGLEASGAVRRTVDMDG